MYGLRDDLTPKTSRNPYTADKNTENREAVYGLRDGGVCNDAASQPQGSSPQKLSSKLQTPMGTPAVIRPQSVTSAFTVEIFPQKRPKWPILGEFLDSERTSVSLGNTDVHVGVTKSIISMHDRNRYGRDSQRFRP